MSNVIVNPTYDQLFGNQDYYTINPETSVLSAAAYYAELLTLVERYIPDGKAKLTFYRTKLCDKSIDEVSSNELVSKISIVTKVLEDYLEDKGVDLSSQNYPFDFPFNEPLHAIRLYLQQNNTDLVSLWRQLPSSDNKIPDKAFQLESIKLSILHWNIIKTASTASSKPSLSDLLGGINVDELVTKPSKVSDFLKCTNLSMDQLHSLLYQDLSEAEWAAMAKLFYINKDNGGDKNINIVGQTLIHLSGENLDRIQRFLRLAKHLDWLYEDLDWALQTAANISKESTLSIDDNALKYLAWFNTMKNDFGINVNQSCAMVGNFKNYGQANGPDFLSSIFDNDGVPGLINCDPTVSSISSLYDLITLNSRSGAKKISWAFSSQDPWHSSVLNALSSALGITPSDLSSICEVIISNSSVHPTELELSNLIEESNYLPVIYRFSLLSNIAGLNTEEVLLALELVSPSNNALLKVLSSPKLGRASNIISAINTLTGFVKWLNDSKFDIYQLQLIMKGDCSKPSLQNTIISSNKAKNFKAELKASLNNCLITPEEFTKQISPLLRQKASAQINSIKSVNPDINKNETLHYSSIASNLESKLKVEVGTKGKGYIHSSGVVSSTVLPADHFSVKGSAEDLLEQSALLPALPANEKVNCSIKFNSTIYAGSNKGLYKYDTTNQKWVQEYGIKFQVNCLEVFNVGPAASAVPGLVVGTEKGIYTSQGLVPAYTFHESLPTALSVNIQSLCLCNDNLVFNTVNHGVWFFQGSIDNSDERHIGQWPGFLSGSEGSTGSLVGFDGVLTYVWSSHVLPGSNVLQTTTEIDAPPPPPGPLSPGPLPSLPAPNTFGPTWKTQSGVGGFKAFNHASDGTFYTCTAEEVYSVTDSGGTIIWSAVGNCVEAFAKNTINSLSSLEGRLFVGTDKGVYQYNTLEKNWTQAVKKSINTKVVSLSSHSGGLLVGLENGVVFDIDKANLSDNISISALLGPYYQNQQTTLDSHFSSLFKLDQKTVASLKHWAASNFNVLPYVDIKQNPSGLLDWILYKASDKHLEILLQQLQRVALFINSLHLSSAEAEYFIKDYQPSNKHPISLESIEEIGTYKKITQQYSDSNGSLLAILQSEGPPYHSSAYLSKALSNFFGCKISKISAIINKAPSSLDSRPLSKILFISNRLQLLDDLNISNETLTKIQTLANLNSTSITGLVEKAAVEFMVKSEASLVELQENVIKEFKVKLITLEKELASALWAGLQKENAGQLNCLRNKLLEQKRDHLVSYVLHDLGLSFPRDLYEYFFIDVEVDASLQTSVLREAISAIQIFINRCLNNLESGITPLDSLPGIWSWMYSYREWQANKEVFLHPQNYIKPELRKNKTEIFTKAEHALKQADLTDQSQVDGVLLEYIEDFLDIADLTISVACQRNYNASNGKELNQIALVGKSAQVHGNYFFRLVTRDGEEILDYGEWKKIPVKISPAECLAGAGSKTSASTTTSTKNNIKTTTETIITKTPVPASVTSTYGVVTPIFAFGRWYLFWVSEKHTGGSPPTSIKPTSNSSVTPLYTRDINFTCQGASGRWKPPHVFVSISCVPKICKPADTSIHSITHGASDISIVYGASKTVYSFPGDGVDNPKLNMIDTTALGTSRLAGLLNVKLTTKGYLLSYLQSAIHVKDVLATDIQTKIGEKYFSAPSIFKPYLWELFFHIPFLIANELKIHRQYKEAKQWYQLLFNPNNWDSSVKDSVWPFIGLKESNNTTLKSELSETHFVTVWDDLHNKEQKEISLDDPFDPQAIAELRPIAYQKAILFNYIQNIIAWGDGFYLENTRTSINEAEIMYVLAYDLLGPKPKCLDKININSNTLYSWINGIDFDFLGTFNQSKILIHYSSDLIVWKPEGAKTSWYKLNLPMSVSLSQACEVGGQIYLATETGLYKLMVDQSGMFSLSNLFFIPSILNEKSLSSLLLEKIEGGVSENGKSLLIVTANYGMVGSAMYSVDPINNTYKKVSLKKPILASNILFSKSYNKYLFFAVGGDALFYLTFSQLVSNNNESATKIQPTFPAKNDQAYNITALKITKNGIQFAWQSQPLSGPPKALLGFYSATDLSSVDLGAVYSLDDNQSYFNPISEFSIVEGGSSTQIYYMTDSTMTSDQTNIYYMPNAQSSNKTFSLTVEYGKSITIYFRNSLPPLAYLPTVGLGGINPQRKGTSDSPYEAAYNWIYYHASTGVPTIDSAQPGVPYTYNIMGSTHIEGKLFIIWQSSSDWGYKQDEGDFIKVKGLSAIGGRASVFLIDEMVCIVALSTGKILTLTLGETGNFELNSTAFSEKLNDSPTRYQFGIPQNKHLLSYWSTLSERLYNIRHGLTLGGQPDQLPLFQPSINPMEMVEAVASGESIQTAVKASNNTVPLYRFPVIIQKAQSATQQVIQLGQSLLSAMEKKDAEQLASLYNTHQQKMSQMMVSSRVNDYSVAGSRYHSLVLSKTSATSRQSHYQGLFNDGLNSGEKAQMAMSVIATMMQAYVEPVKVASIIGYMMPTVFGLADGAFHPGDAINKGAEMANDAANILREIGGMAATSASYQRRSNDWSFQASQAKDDVAQITHQIHAAKITTENAKHSIDVMNTAIKQEQSVAAFYLNKFTSEQLYQWYVGKLSALYFQAYQMAHDLAMQAENAWKFEHTGSMAPSQSTAPGSGNFIQSGYWNSLYQGLLSGESLMLDLHRMDKAYMEQNVRRLELEKTISLAQLDPMQFTTLKNSGSCQFDITEMDFAFDFPGHYCRQIKTVSVSIPVVLGPYENVHATLTQLDNKTVVSDNAGGIQAVKYLLGDQGKAGNALQMDVRPNEQIALTQGINDSGLFTLNFNDERYLPFEGTGAISSWQLDLPKADNNFDLEHLSDVIITLKYTALAANSAYQQVVLEKRAKYNGASVLSLAHLNPALWQEFNQTDSKPLKITLPRNMFRRNFDTYAVTGVQMVVAGNDITGTLNAKLTSDLKTSGDIDFTSRASTLKGNNNSVAGEIGINTNFSIAATPGDSWTLKAITLPDKIENIFLLVDYSAALNTSDS